jgi:hypothetical protein
MSFPACFRESRELISGYEFSKLLRCSCENHGFRDKDLKGKVKRSLSHRILKQDKQAGLMRNMMEPFPFSFPFSFFKFLFYFLYFIRFSSFIFKRLSPS